VTSEFFEQGDRERSELKLTPAVRIFSHQHISLKLADLSIDCLHFYFVFRPFLTVIVKMSFLCFRWNGLMEFVSHYMR